MAKNKVRVTDVNGQEVALPTLSDIGQTIKQGASNIWNNVIKPGASKVGTDILAATNPGYALGKSVVEGAREAYNPDTNTFEFTIGKNKNTPMASPSPVTNRVPVVGQDIAASDLAMEQGLPAWQEAYLTNNFEEDPLPDGRSWDVNGNDGFDDKGLEYYLALIDQQRAAEGLPPLYNGNNPSDNGGNGGNGGTGIPDFEYTPTQFSSKYYDQMNAILNDLALDKFKFDLNGEELYQQYKDQYLRNGRLAMMDTMGQAAGLTGGYGSTYSQNAGQQAYQGYVNDLNNVVPDVYNAAYTRWRDSISDKLNQYKLLADADKTDYDRWADEESRNYTQAWNEYSQQSKERMAQIDAETERQKNELDAQTAREKSMVGNGWYYGPDGQLVPNGYEIGSDGKYYKVVDINGLPEKDLINTVETSLRNLEAQGGILAVYGNGMANMTKTNPTAVAQTIARKIGQENGWDPSQTSYAAAYILEVLREEE